jgi:16S rRNA (uracil1498-N3)-methyltransferase
VSSGGGPGSVGAAAHAFVRDLDAPVLAAEDRHHLERVLRLRRGEQVTVSDGAGGWRACSFGSELQPEGDVTHDPAPSPPITVAFALLKGERPELVVQKLTELGVDRIAPMVTARCIVQWSATQSERHGERLRRIAREAAMQSRRSWLPTVEEVRPFAEVAAGTHSVLADAGGGPVSLERPVVLVGPEGGWAPEEAACGLPTVALGPHVLRAETASIAAATLLVAKRASLV